MDGQSALRGGQQNGSTGGSQRDRRGKTLHINHALDGHGCGLEARHGIREARVDFQQATGNRELRGIFYDIEMQTPNLAGRALEHGKAGSAQGGIDREQDFIGVHSTKRSKVAEGHGACGRHEFIGLLAVLEIRHGFVALDGECDLAGANEARWTRR